MLEPTSGHVTVEGLDNRMHIQDVRKMVGFCPQYGREERLRKTFSYFDLFILDILYSELSVQEHLELVGKVFITKKRCISRLV
jgi:ABC-type multidrug transport system ATPase subunit